MNITKLSNGVRVVVVPRKGLKSVTVEVFLKIGSKYEKPGEHGLSHFLEHMAFKGTHKRLSAEAVNQEIDAKGADWNAGTEQETTSYYIKTVKENTKWALELLSDIVLDPVIKDEEVIRERGVIVEELKMYNDNPAMGLSEDFYQFFFGESPIGCWDVGGKVEEVEQYNRKDIFSYRNRYINPKEMVVVIAGDIDNTNEIELVADKYFGDYSNPRSILLPKVEVVVTNKKEMIKYKQVEQGHFCVGVEGITRSDERKYILKCLQILLAGNTSSRLFNEIREKRGWAYYVHLIDNSFEETGLVGIQSGVKLDKLSEAIELTIKEMTAMKDSVTDQEISRAKSFLRGKIGLMMDRTDYWTSYVGQRVLFDEELRFPEEEFKKIDEVKVESVKELAGELFQAEKFKKIWVSNKVG